MIHRKQGVSRKGSRSLQTSWFGPVIYDKFSVTVNIGILYCVVNYLCLDVMKSKSFDVSVEIKTATTTPGPRIMKDLRLKSKV